MLLLSDELYHDFFNDAQDPATSADRLEWFAWHMHQETLHEQRAFAGIAMEREEQHRERAAQIFRAVAGNPNASVKTLMWLACYAATIVLRNPIMPLLLLEGNWSEWTSTGTSWLRKTAYEQGHDAFPVLAGICKPEWRRMSRPINVTVGRKHIMSVDPAVAECTDPLCATCHPKNAENFKAIWKAKHAN